MNRLARYHSVLPPATPSKGLRRSDSVIKSTLLYKGFRRDERGNNKGATDWSDKDIVGENKVRINEVKVWFDKEKITGVAFNYITEKGDSIKGEDYVLDPDNSQSETLEIKEDDYLKEVSGFINKDEDVIECLILTTFTGEGKKIGISGGKDSKLFKLDINELEYPSIAYGSIKGEKDQ